MKAKVLPVILALIFILSCAKKKEEKEQKIPAVEQPIVSPGEISPPLGMVGSENMDEFYINYMVEQAKLNREYIHKTSPEDRREYEKKAQAIHDKYNLNQHMDFRQYYAQLSPERQMEFMTKIDQAMKNAGLQP